jgi:ectoine hydroxylase-related dioxygenase (phytanoyl-CoA dioxygenase family)
VQKLESFHRIAHHPNLLQMYRTLFGAAVFVHPRNIARVILPHKDNVPTPAHQDFIHVQGTTNTWTCWFPLGDCSMALGGLAVLRGSQTRGVRHAEDALGAGRKESQICSDEREWVQGDYEVGDVLTFPSLTVHKALPNQYKDRLRLSCDFRYQRADDVIEKNSLDVHGGIISWDKVYEGWKDKSLQYYWKGKEPEITPWNEAIRWQKARIC